MEQKKTLLIDGWYDLHKTSRNLKGKDETVDILWEIPMSKFMELLFPFYDGKDIYRAEGYREYCHNDFHALSEYMYSEVHKTDICEGLMKYVSAAVKEAKIEEISKRIKFLLDNYNGDIVPTDILRIEYERLKGSNDVKKWADFLYYYEYFAVTGRVHQNLGYGKYPDLEKDLEEYKTNVVMGYGCSGVPGMSKIYALATREKPNIIALYELGEMEYYGRGPSGVVNFENAYNYYYQTLELNNAHPLALWSIAYMKFNYKRKNSELEYASIPELDDEMPTETETIMGKRKHRKWCEDILNKVTESYGYGCAAAANLIGKIIDTSEDEFPTAYRGWLKGHKAIDFYKESADKNYSFGCNNYALRCLKMAGEAEDEQNTKEYGKQAIEYLKKSAKEGEVWAANKLGKMYITGLEINGCQILKADESEAYKYFTQAECFFGVRKYYRALINMCNDLYCNEKSKYYKRVSADVLLKKLKKALDVLTDSQADQIEQIKKNIEIISKWEK